MNELTHHGVKGMKWGKRKVRGHAGPGIYLTEKRRLAGYKKDLDTLNKGGHLSVGLTKKRQAAFDARDRRILEKRISDIERKQVKPSEDSSKVKNIRKKHIDEMTNQELKDANYRLQMERQYKDLTAKKSIGKQAVQTFIGVAGTIVAVETAAKTYKRLADLAIDKIGKNAIK